MSNPLEKIRLGGGEQQGTGRPEMTPSQGAGGKVRRPGAPVPCPKDCPDVTEAAKTRAGPCPVCGPLSQPCHCLQNIPVFVKFANTAPACVLFLAAPSHLRALGRGGPGCCLAGWGAGGRRGRGRTRVALPSRAPDPFVHFVDWGTRLWRQRSRQECRPLPFSGGWVGQYTWHPSDR